MKTKNLAYALFVAIGMASCATESNDPVENTCKAADLERDFNARSIVYNENDKNSPKLSELPALNAEEVATILTDLRKQEGVKESRDIQFREGVPGQTFLTTSARQQIAPKHTLTIELDMIAYDDGSLYYKDHRGFDASSEYEWDVTRFTLSSNGDNGKYRFECTGYLYFKMADNGIKYIQVPIQVKGSYNIQNHDISFKYSL